MQRQEIRFVDHRMELEGSVLIVIRPFNEPAHFGDRRPRQVAGCGQWQAVALDQSP